MSSLLLLSPNCASTLQVSAVSTNPEDDPVIFHRGPVVWDMTSFDNTNRLVGRDGTPIAVDTILTLDQFTGKVSARNFIEKTTYSFLNIFKCDVFKNADEFLKMDNNELFFLQLILFMLNKEATVLFQAMCTYILHCIIDRIQHQLFCKVYHRKSSNKLFYRSAVL